MAWMVLFLFYHFEMLLFWCWKSDAFFPLPIFKSNANSEKKNQQFLFISLLGELMPTEKWTKNYFDETEEKQKQKNTFVIHIRQWDGMCKKQFRLETMQNVILYIKNVCKNWMEIYLKWTVDRWHLLKEEWQNQKGKYISIMVSSFLARLRSHWYRFQLVCINETMAIISCVSSLVQDSEKRCYFYIMLTLNFMPLISLSLYMPCIQWLTSK